MGTDRLADLNAPLERYQLLVAADLPGINFQTVQERHRVVAAINAVWQNPIAIRIFGQTVGEVIQIIAAIDLFHDRPRSSFPLNLKAEACRRRFILIEINALAVDIAVRRRAALQCHAEGGNFLDQMLVIGVQRVKPIDHIVFFLMRGGIAQRKERLELFEAFLGLLALHALRLVDDQDWICLCNDVDGLAAAERVELFVNDALILAGIERLHVDDHDIDRAVRRKAVNFRQSVGIVDEKADFLVVFARKMLLRGLERFIDALADGDGRHNDDELAPAVALVQLIHRFDVGIGLARAGFHLDGKIDARPGQLIRGFQAVPALHRAQVVQQLSVRQLRHKRLITEADLGIIGAYLHARQIAKIAAIRHRAVRLAAEHVADGIGGFRLKRLVLELQLHQITFTFVSGERFLNISVTLILLSSAANELSRNTARSGCCFAM